tara:strand:+ start:8759 stop:9100 length:342 start_codon:yes stop_codon:yes gene_type:complete
MMDNAYLNPMGWETKTEDDVNHKEFERIAREAYEMCIIIKKVFSSNEGKRVFDWLCEQTIASPTWRSSLDYEKAIAHGFAREGQNALVHDLKHKMQLAERCKSLDDFMNRFDR